MSKIAQSRPYRLSGRMVDQFRSMANLIWATTQTSLRRLVLGPRYPGWTWGFETTMTFLKAQSRAANGFGDVRRAREYEDALVFYSPALAETDLSLVEGGVRGSWYTPAQREPDGVVLYFHGGGYAFYSRAHANMCALVAKATKRRLFAVDYRLAPEWPYPNQLDDARAAYEWLLAKGLAPDQIVVAGDSAGGNLVLGLLVCLKETNRPLPAAAICIAPWTDLGNSGASMVVNERYDWIDRDMADRWASWYLQGQSVVDPKVSPRLADMRGWPPVYVQVGGADILYDQIVSFCQQCGQKGADLQLDTWEGMTHDFQAFGEQMPESSEALRRLGEFTDAHLSNGDRIEQGSAKTRAT
ncbi:MAG TPA: alpha/beta hydrolase [Anaerolineales bacterium]|nr:alpha/beta hydrolase [Anaerolineales bacterium]